MSEVRWGKEEEEEEEDDGDDDDDNGDDEVAPMKPFFVCVKRNHDHHNHPYFCFHCDKWLTTTKTER